MFSINDTSYVIFLYCKSLCIGTINADVIDFLHDVMFPCNGIFPCIHLYIVVYTYVNVLSMKSNSSYNILTLFGACGKRHFKK